MWLLDVNMPKKVAAVLGEFEIEAHTASDRGWGDLTNGALVEAGFECILTRDRLFSDSAARTLKRFPSFCVVLVTIPQLRGAEFLDRFSDYARLDLHAWRATSFDRSQTQPPGSITEAVSSSGETLTFPGAGVDIAQALVAARGSTNATAICPTAPPWRMDTCRKSGGEGGQKTGKQNDIYDSQNRGRSIRHFLVAPILNILNQ